MTRPLCLECSQPAATDLAHGWWCWAHWAAHVLQPRQGCWVGGHYELRGVSPDKDEKA